MKRNSVKTLVTALTIATFSFVLFGCKKDDSYNYSPPPSGSDASVMTAAGDSATIIGTINQFRHLLGDSLNKVPGATSGRREVNWDGVPGAFTNQNNFPFDFFNSTNPADAAGRKRGLVYTNNSAGFRVDSTNFSEVDPSYSNQFVAFSKKRLFASVGNNVSGVAFQVPGTSADAFVKGFGVIFSDVDSDNSTYAEFFSGNKSLGVFKAPQHPAGGNFSFLGVSFKDAKVTGIKITSGNGVLAAGVKDVSDGGDKDLVVMDDFFYSEPLATQ